MKKQHLVFVYGTLKDGYGNHHILEDSKYIGEAITVEKYPMYSNGYFPYLINAEDSGNRVYGELYSVNDDVLKELDYLEGVPDHYYRDVIDVGCLKDNKRYKASVYFMTNPPRNVHQKSLISVF